MNGNANSLSLVVSTIASNAYVILLGLGIVLVLALAFCWIYQYRHRRRLNAELAQIARLRNNSIEYELVLKAMKLCTWRLDVRQGIVYFESDFRDLPGNYQAPSQLPLDKILDWVVFEDKDSTRRSFLSIARGQVDSIHLVFRSMLPHMDRQFWMECYATVAEVDEEGKPLVVVGTSMCIDKRKRMEEELVAARNKAEESDRLKSAFLANIGHEVHTPLNAIVGFSEILPMAGSEEERERMMGIIRENNEKLLHIFDDIVNLSRIEADYETEKIVMEWFDVTALVRETVKETAGRNARPQLTVNAELATEAAFRIYSNRERVSVILSHLADNALKFTEKGCVTIGTAFPDDSKLRIFVKDTGIGIPAADCERIFERFVKLDDFTQGMGLGLTVSRTFALSLGGSVGVSSELGLGSTFWLDLPVTK